MPWRLMEPPRGMGGPPEPDYRGDLGGDHHVQAAKVLGLAQEMADRLTAEAKSEADSMLSDARNKSEQLLSDARAKSDGLVNDARSRAETMLNDARTRAETLERQSRDKAAQLCGPCRAQADRDHRGHHAGQVRAGETRSTSSGPSSASTAHGSPTTWSLSCVTWTGGGPRRRWTPGPPRTAGTPLATAGYGQRADAGS